MRESYGCPCNGPVLGRINPKMTDGILSTVEQWTGYRYDGCPWHAFSEPIVIRIAQAYSYFDKGQLDIIEPDAPNRVVEGLRHYDHMLSVCRGKQLDLDIEARRQR